MYQILVVGPARRQGLQGVLFYRKYRASVNYEQHMQQLRERR